MTGGYTPGTSRLPRTRGDEPLGVGAPTGEHAVCPAPAGMSPADRWNQRKVMSLPRTRGDEPNPRSPVRVVKGSAPHPRG